MRIGDLLKQNGVGSCIITLNDVRQIKMAISEQLLTYGLLGQWQRIVHENIWHFNQSNGSGTRNEACPVYIQEDREDVAQALNMSFHMFAQYLGYFARPIWNTERVDIGGGYPYFLQPLKLKRGGYLVEFGQRATSVIQANAAVTYSDVDGDGIDDTATITVVNATAVDEVQIFFRTADGAPAAADERYQIEPVKVSTSAGTITITGHRALFVKPSTIWDIPYDPTDPNGQTRNYADTANATGFVTAVDIYRVYNDTTDIGTLNGSLDTQTLTSGNLEIDNAEYGAFISLSLSSQPEYTSVPGWKYFR